MDEKLCEILLSLNYVNKEVKALSQQLNKLNEDFFDLLKLFAVTLSKEDYD